MPEGAGVVQGDKAAVVPGVDARAALEQEVNHVPAPEPWREMDRMGGEERGGEGGRVLFYTLSSFSLGIAPSLIMNPSQSGIYNSNHTASGAALTSLCLALKMNY